MPHEPSDSCPPVQPTADRRCPSCRPVKPLDDFSARADAPGGCCMACRRRSVVAHRRRQRTLRQVARRAEAGYRAPLTELQRGGGDAV
jgi:hypothetical protein